MPSLPRHRLGANDWPHFPYTNGAIDLNDDWGSQTMHEIGKPPQPLDQFNIYNISSESSEWTCRLNGLPLFQTASNSVYFRSDPLLGHNTDDWFLGDIAEVIVYDHVLNDAERMTVGAYLGSKYKLYQPLPVPTNLTATPLSPHQVSLQWTAPARGDHVNYVVERSDGAHSVQIAVPDSLSYIDSGLTPGTIYTYQVQAQGYAGVSAPTSPITVTTLLDGGGTDVPLASTRLWLKADAGISVGTGVNLWVDQSQYGNNATQIVTSNQPQLVTSATDSTLPNNEPVVRFNGTSSYLTLPNFMSGSATNAGEVFMVVRAPLTPAATWRGVWRMGANDWPHFPYTNGAIYLNDDWGSQTMHEIGKPPQPLDQFNIYNISSESSEWTCRLNGIPLFQTASNSVYFRSNPLLGHNTDDWFLGDIAEVVVFDHVLSDEERETVNFYLNNKYKVTDPKAFDFYRDSNYDGLPDGADRGMGFDPSSMDVDGDGDTNLQDILAGLDPLDPNSILPLPPPPAPGEGAPVITVTNPAGAVLLR